MNRRKTLIGSTRFGSSVDQGIKVTKHEDYNQRQNLKIYEAQEISVKKKLALKLNNLR